jgi:hypothetical protein
LGRRRTPAGPPRRSTTEIWELKKPVHISSTPWNAKTKIEVRNLLDVANTTHLEFVEKAHDACEPRSWQRQQRPS